MVICENNYEEIIIMFKKIVALICIATCAGTAYGSTSQLLSKEELEKQMTGIHTKTFSVTNLYKEALESHDWEEILQKTYAFVKKNSNNNESLFKLYAQLQIANRKLIETINKAYDLFFDTEKKTTCI